jgi:transcription antitermination factor NusG
LNRPNGDSDVNVPGITNNPSWWAIYTRHQHEKALAGMLSLKGFEVFLPLYESTRRWKDRQKVLALPLFPSYLFVRGTIDRKLQILTTPGIHMILHHGEHVAVVPEAQIQAIQRTVDGSCRVEPHPFLKCGSRVRVTRGVLEGLEGNLIRKKNLCRLVLSIDMLAKSVAVEVNASDVEPCNLYTSSDSDNELNASNIYMRQSGFSRGLSPRVTAD